MKKRVDKFFAIEYGFAMIRGVHPEYGHVDMFLHIHKRDALSNLKKFGFKPYKGKKHYGQRKWSWSKADNFQLARIITLCPYPAEIYVQNFNQKKLKSTRT